jgi:hypothetical protein
MDERAAHLLFRFTELTKSNAELRAIVRSFALQILSVPEFGSNHCEVMETMRAPVASAPQNTWGRKLIEENRKARVYSRSTKPRNHGLHAETLEKLIEQFNGSKTIPNPYSPGPYFYFIEALKDLGVDKMHRFIVVRDRMQELMSVSDPRIAGKNEWERFVLKVGVATDHNGRIIRNAEVLQRVNDYGLKLLLVGRKVLKTSGLVVDILKGEGGSPLYRLNTDSAVPINEFRQTRGRKTPVETAIPP